MDIHTQLYEFPELEDVEDEASVARDREMRACVPFAVIGSNCIIEVAGRRLRGRQYPWGIVEGQSNMCIACSWIKQHMPTVKFIQDEIIYFCYIYELCKDNTTLLKYIARISNQILKMIKFLDFFFLKLWTIFSSSISILHKFLEKFLTCFCSCGRSRIKSRP